MAQPFYMSITGESQGNITERAGEQEGHENEILCQAFEHAILVPSNEQSGVATGKRVHKAMMITKAVDRSSAQLYSALVNNERLTDVTIKHYRTDPTGTLQNHFTVKLSNAVIISIRAWQPNYLNPATEQISYTEEVSFAYQAIDWLWVDGGVEAMDEWLTTS
ncbi:MAG: type secretion system secreted protein Hcp [Candidatus Poribacteria bacterium]|nr:type secretion system secreted protein Hcp [Candidatus Poribacteria bacterium]